MSERTALWQVFASIKENGDKFKAQIPHDWLQGRTAYGGLSASLALQVARKIETELPLRSAAISFIGPIYGEIELQTKLLRRGKNSAFVEVFIICDGVIGFSANFVFLRPSNAPNYFVNLPAPEHIALKNASNARQGEFVPEFAKRFESLQADLGRIEKEPYILRWLRLDDCTNIDDTSLLVAMADASPPPAIYYLKKLMRISSVNWYFNILDAEPKTENGWYLFESSSNYIANGFSNQNMTLWNTELKPLMQAMQSVALFE